MEQIKKLVESQINSLRNCSQKNTVQIQDGEVSIYEGALNTDCVIYNIARVKKAFPSLPLDFFDVFTDRINESGFNDDRLRDAVNHVIDTCVYPTPTIAQFISFDKKYKVFTYDEMLKKCDELGAEIWKSYQSIDLTEIEKPVYAHINDIKKYHLKCKT